MSIPDGWQTARRICGLWFRVGRDPMRSFEGNPHCYTAQIRVSDYVYAARGKTPRGALRAAVAKARAGGGR